MIVRRKLSAVVLPAEFPITMAALSQVLGFFFLLSLLPWLAVTIHHGEEAEEEGTFSDVLGGMRSKCILSLP